ncbi:MAG: PAS domain-containing protein [Gloeocapsa sp. UFS-A4-WI-NPMV-4B04]|jgi:PAS domain S-box-containing protein|nr:PAS domain-containing protein [Gloeocapsa sp. UFS-A4-WI-NPMV-4B04]
MNVDMFSQQIEGVNRRLNELYQNANTTVKLQPELLPIAFKELGIVSEELQVAVEELQQQNEALAAAKLEVEIQRQRYQDLFDFAPHGYLVTDPNGIIQEANRAAANLLNISQQFLIGKPLIIFVIEEQHPLFQEKLTQFQQTEQVQEWVVRLCPRKGEPFEAALTTISFTDSKGNVLGMRISIRDISNAGKISLPMQTEVLGKNNDALQDSQKHIFLKGEIIPLNPQVIWQVCKGVVKLNTMGENGEEVLVGLAGPSMPFGTDLTSLPTYQATALSEVELVCFSVTDIAASPYLAQRILPQINQRLRQTEALLAISGQRRVKARFLQLLQLLKTEIGQQMDQGTRLSVRFTHQDFADACSTTRVTITRVLGKLQEQGDILIDSKNHIILKD